MAVFGKSGLVWSLLLSSGRGRCVREVVQQRICRSVSVSSGSSKFTTCRERHTQARDPALKINPKHSWTSHWRGLSSEAPYQEDVYPPLPEYVPTQETDTQEVFIIRVRGLPWSCSAEDLVKFFSECQIRGGVNGVHLMLQKNGKPNGQAFIELEHEKDVTKALERHKQYLGPRYVEVYEVTNKDAEIFLKSTDDGPGTDGVVRLRGLPFNCTEQDVFQFFSGLDIMKDGVTLVLDRKGRNSGDAYVQFATQNMADQALQKDREVIGNRYIEVFPSKKSEIKRQYSKGREEVSGTAFLRQRTNSVSVPIHYIHMRGLPYEATAGDIVNFFSPVRVAKILMEFGPDGQPCGEAEAYFASHQDAVAAMSKDKESIQNRYIELFLNSSARGDGL